LLDESSVRKNSSENDIENIQTSKNKKDDTVLRSQSEPDSNQSSNGSTESRSPSSTNSDGNVKIPSENVDSNSAQNSRPVTFWQF
jgi:hypothetical protein